MPGRGDTVNAVALRVVSTPPGQVFAAHVVAGQSVDAQTARWVAGLDPAFLVEAGWDPVTQILRPPAGHALLGRAVCRAPGCQATPVGAARVCGICRRKLAAAGLNTGQVGMLAAVPAPPQPPDHGPCLVVSCDRFARNRGGAYCDAHQQRFRAAGRRGAIVDEPRWRRVEAPISHSGQVSMRGLAPMVIAQVLLGLQQRCRFDGVKTRQGDLRLWCNDLRATQAVGLTGPRRLADRGGTLGAMVNAVTGHAMRAMSTPESEIVGDVWDLAVFGHCGGLDFTVITQRWLREATKRWAADDLPRRRIRPGRQTSGGQSVRHHVGAVARLSQALRVRDDHGDDPTALGRTDMEAFGNRLAYLESTGTISADARVRTCREVRAVLTRIRALGLTRPGGLAAGLGEDFALHRDDIPAESEPSQEGRGLPPEILRQICAHLDEVTSPQMRTAFEMAIDTGRRPEEICDLRLDCLIRDNDNAPVLIYDNHKANRLGRRLPITEATATVINTQQQRVRARYPTTPTADLKLLPTDRRNPTGSRAITAFSLAFHHRVWINRIPELRTLDNLEFDKRRVVIYAYRHSYAQRHADAGIPIDVLRELMDHRKLDTTKQYYHVGQARRREAVDRVAAWQFDRHGNRVWHTAQHLLDQAQAHQGIGCVAVPFGTCAEPSNVHTGGSGCPYRFRCAGCDHFRTDASYLPDLHAYLDDLLRTRERLRAATDLDAWARTDATPSAEEITRIRRLVAQVTASLNLLTADQRIRIDDAITAVREHRTTMLGLPRTRPTLPSPERTA